MNGRKPTPCTAPWISSRRRSTILNLYLAVTYDDHLRQFEIMRFGNFAHRSAGGANENGPVHFVAGHITRLTAVGALHSQHGDIDQQFRTLQHGTCAQNVERLTQYILRERAAAPETHLSYRRDMFAPQLV